MTNLVEGKLGDVGEYSVVIDGGNLILNAKMDISKELDKIEIAIPGKLDDLILEVLKGLIKRL